MKKKHYFGRGAMFLLCLAFAALFLLFLLTVLLNFIVAQFIENSRYVKKLWLFFGIVF